MSPSALTKWPLPDGSTHHRILGRSYAFWRILAMVSSLCLRPYMGLNSPRRVPVIVADILRLWSSVRPLAWGCLSPSLLPDTFSFWGMPLCPISTAINYRQIVFVLPNDILPDLFDLGKLYDQFSWFRDIL